MSQIRPIVLVVDDDAAVQTLIRHALERAGCRVILAGGAAAALRLFAEYPEGISLVISDVVMPGMNGVDLAKRLRQLRPEQRIILISGSFDSVDASRVQEFVCIPKPVPIARLVERARDLMAAAA